MDEEKELEDLLENLNKDLNKLSAILENIDPEKNNNEYLKINSQIEEISIEIKNKKEDLEFLQYGNQDDEDLGSDRASEGLGYQDISFDPFE